jgi:hypothetical protein
VRDLLRWWPWRRPSAPVRPALALVGGSDVDLLRARLTSAEGALARAQAREAALLRENEKLASQLAREARKADEALNKLDEVAQRLARCTCAVGSAIAQELDELNGIGRT